MRARAAALLCALVLPGAGAAEPPAPAGAPSRASPAAAAADTDRGDRGALRAALFASQDAVYREPGSAAAHVRLGRAYLALGYPPQARAQADRALALVPADAEAHRLLDDALHALGPPTAAPGAGGGAERAARDRAPAPSASAPGDGRLVGQAAIAAAPGAAPGAAAPDGVAGEAALRYRAGVDLLERGDYALAAEALDLAIAADPKLAVAYVARGNARLGLGRTRAAALDYGAALELAPGLAMPLYGLAECYRAEGDPRELELYVRYTRSHAADVREDLRTLAVRRVSELARQR